MKKEEIRRWRESTVEEIKSRITETENQLYKLKHQLHIGQLKNYSTIRSKKKEIGILKTLIGEKNEIKKNGKN